MSRILNKYLNFKKNKNKVFFDSRWTGDHGIARFAREIRARLSDIPNANLNGRPASPVDCIRTWLWLLCHPDSVLFTPGYNAPLFCQSRSVITVHDLNHIDFPAQKNWLKKLYYGLVLKRACCNAKATFTVSEFSRNRILDWSGASSHKVINVGNGVSREFHAGGRDLDVESPYFLMVSNRKPHKNEQRVFNAFQKSDITADVRLLVTGDPTADQLEWMRVNKMFRRVVFVGAVSDEEICKLYKGALALVFMSLYEGFGLPAVEAMACGTPVIASNTTALKEVVGGAGVLVAPLELDGIRRALELVWGSSQLRLELSSSGIKRAKIYSWTDVVENVKRYIYLAGDKS